MIRKSTAFLRVLPNYLIIGAQKAGTSSLFNYLSMHPQVKNSYKKEVHYFDKNYDKPINWYKQYFPFKFGVNDKTMIGEATPNYLYHPFVAGRIKKTIPDVKMIVLLRNPVERVISQYFQAVRKNNEKRPLMQSLLEEEQEEKIIFEKLTKDENYYPTEAHVLYKSRSRYAEQLKRYYELFDKEQIFVVSSKDLLLKPNEVLEKIFAFLGIDTHFYLREINLLNVGTNKKDVPQDVISYLNDYFKPYNEELFNLLGYKIDW
ncbi:MAG TPA: sulfotransferase [Bacteroidales bacterium]|jgi:hypothetical protein|nr:sulfotransferase domain-containing protein [Bacteroidales bacterium]HOU98655.1 sulfotransferase [Bacteroidales bacterium]